MKGRMSRILSIAAAMALALSTAAAPLAPAPVRADTGVSITGAVTGSAGNLGGILVVPCPTTSPGCGPGTRTDDSGNFTIGGVLPGDYWVFFHDPTYTYVDGNYTDTGHLQDWPFTVTVGASDITLNTVQLDLASTISGTLAGRIQGPVSMGACLRPSYCISASPDGSGHFVFRGLEAGTYIIQASMPSDPLTTHYYSDSGSPVVDRSLATPITVPPSASGLVFFLTTVTVPEAPTRVTANAGDGSAAVMWDTGSDGGSPVTSYTVTASDSVHSCVTTTQTCYFSGLVNGTTYTFTVTATNSVGTGPASAPSNPVIPVAPPVRQSQSISFGPLPDTVYGAAPITVNAVATSGLPVDISVAGVCTSVGSTVIVTGVGGCGVLAFQNGDAHWLPADQVSQHFSVAPAPLSVSVPSASRPYGAANPAFVPAISGFVNGDTNANLTAQPTCSTTATASSSAGTYPITCSGASAAKYSITYVPGTLTVAPVPLTVTAPSAARAYGATNPAFTPTYSGFVNGDTAASLTAQPTCTTAATPASPVGTYPINCSGAASANYAITCVSGTLTIAIADRFVDPARTTLNVAAPGFLALTNASGATVIISTRPAGKLTLGTGGAFTYVPKGNFVGVDSFAYRLNVGGRLSAPATVKIYVVGPGMSCKGCNLSGLGLSWAALGGANLKEANLAASRLDHANLRGADLSRADLSNANLAYANLKGANLARAVLTNVDLTGADLAGANLAGVTWSNTTCPDGTNSTTDGGSCRGHLGP